MVLNSFFEHNLSPQINWTHENINENRNSSSNIVQDVLFGLCFILFYFTLLWHEATIYLDRWDMSLQRNGEYPCKVPSYNRVLTIERSHIAKKMRGKGIFGCLSSTSYSRFSALHRKRRCLIHSFLRKTFVMCRNASQWF
jgi:hypothetical protein